MPSIPRKHWATWSHVSSWLSILICGKELGSCRAGRLALQKQIEWNELSVHIITCNKSEEWRMMLHMHANWRHLPLAGSHGWTVVGCIRPTAIPGDDIRVCILPRHGAVPESPLWDQHVLLLPGSGQPQILLIWVQVISLPTILGRGNIDQNPIQKRGYTLAPPLASRHTNIWQCI